MYRKSMGQFIPFGLSTMPVAESDAIQRCSGENSTFCIRVGQRCEPGHGCHGACRRTAPQKNPRFTAAQHGKPNSVPHEKRCLQTKQ